MLKVGDVAPDKIVITAEDGSAVSLAMFRGKYIVLYFYPKNNTPGCTKEACSFRDANEELRSLGAEVIGVSKDTVKSHQKFRELHHLNFRLWSDPEHQLIEAFGAWQEKSFMGKKFMGIVRSTFIIDPHGNIAHVWESVNPLNHSQEVLEVMKKLQQK